MQTSTNNCAQEAQSTTYGAPRILQPTKINPFQSIVSFHQFFTGRPTIVPIIVCDNKVLIVKSSRHSHWSLPQGGIKISDGTLMYAALREGSEELGLNEKHLLLPKRQMIGEYPNPMPKNRNLGYECKHMFLIALPVNRQDWVKLNEENQEFSWVHSFDEFISMISGEAEERWVKFQATCEAIGEVCKTGLLSWQVEPQRELAFA